MSTISHPLIFDEYFKTGLSPSLFSRCSRALSWKQWSAAAQTSPCISSGEHLHHHLSPDIPLHLQLVMIKQLTNQCHPFQPRSVATYKGIDSTAPLISWFWAVMEEFSTAERR